MNVAVELFSVVFVFADFLVDQSAYKGYVGKNIKPQHQDNYGSKRTIDSGIFYRRTYEPGEKSAYNGKNDRTENRAGKNVYVIWASPRVCIIDNIKHSGGNNV